MPVHDRSHVEAGLFDDFHHAWIEELKRAITGGVLPEGYYALAEQFAGPFGPDVLTLQDIMGPTTAPVSSGTAETEMQSDRRKQAVVAIRHVTNDRVVAMIEVVSPGNKSGRAAVDSFVRKTAELLERGVHLLILDLLPPGPRDPRGIHALIWEYLDGTETSPPGKPLTIVAYEADLATRAYVVPVAVGDTLPPMPLFLAPGACVDVPLEATYQSAFAVFPRRWKPVLEGAGPGP